MNYQFIFFRKIEIFLCLIDNCHKSKYCYATNSPRCIVFFVRAVQETSKRTKKTMDCDRSAYFQKAIKATARQFTN